MNKCFDLFLVVWTCILFDVTIHRASEPVATWSNRMCLWVVWTTRTPPPLKSSAWTNRFKDKSKQSSRYASTWRVNTLSQSVSHALIRMQIDYRNGALIVTRRVGCPVLSVFHSTRLMCSSVSFSRSTRTGPIITCKSGTTMASPPPEAATWRASRRTFTRMPVNRCSSLDRCADRRLWSVVRRRRPLSRASDVWSPIWPMICTMAFYWSTWSSPSVSRLIDSDPNPWIHSINHSFCIRLQPTVHSLLASTIDPRRMMKW